MTISCTCQTCHKCYNRNRMRAMREVQPKPLKPVTLDAIDLKAIAVWARHQDYSEHRDPLASTWRAIEATR